MSAPDLAKLESAWRNRVAVSVAIAPVTVQLCALMDERFAVKCVDVVVSECGEEFALELFYRASGLIAALAPDAFCKREPERVRTLGGMFLHLAWHDEQSRPALVRIRAAAQKLRRAGRPKTQCQRDRNHARQREKRRALAALNLRQNNSAGAHK